MVVLSLSRGSGARCLDPHLATERSGRGDAGAARERGVAAATTAEVEAAQREHVIEVEPIARTEAGELGVLRLQPARGELRDEAREHFGNDGGGVPPVLGGVVEAALHGLGVPLRDLRHAGVLRR